VSVAPTITIKRDDAGNRTVTFALPAKVTGSGETRRVEREAMRTSVIFGPDEWDEFLAMLELASAP
jgi:hypothetical protein